MRRTFHSLLIISGLFLVHQESWGRDWRVNQIPNGQTFSCLNCHLTSEGGGAVNVFGESVDCRVDIVTYYESELIKKFVNEFGDKPIIGKNGMVK